MKRLLSLFLGLLISTGIAFAGGPLPSPPIVVEEIDGAPTGVPWKVRVSNGALTDNGDGTFTLVTGVGGGGDVSGGALSANGELVVYDGTGGKTIKQSGLGAGIVKLSAAAVPSIAAAGTDYLAPAGIGVTVQAYSAVLDTWATKTVTASEAELNYVAGVTSAIQTQLGTKSPTANPTFTGVVTMPTPFTLGATSVTTTGAQLNYLNAATGTTGTATTSLVFSTSPTLVTPTLGAATATSINKVAITAPATASTLTIADGKTLTVSKTMQLTSPDDTTVATFPAGAVTVGVTGTLTNTKWCRTDGTSIICDQDAPAGAGTITKVGDITSGEAFSTSTPGKTLIFNNATSGTITLQTVAGALGTGTIVSLPAVTGTIQVSPTTVTAGQVFQGTTTAGLGAWSTAIYPLTTTANQILYSSSTNTVVGLATGNSGVLVTSAGGVPSISTTLPAVTLTTPVLGVATATSVNKWTFTAPTTAATLTAGADNAVYTMPAATKTIAANDGSNWTIASQAIGDMLVATSTTAYGRLGAGAAGYILTAAGAGAPPVWATPAAATAHVVLDSAVHTDTLTGTVLAGDIIIGNATPKWSRLAKGTQYQTLVMGASLPAWGTLPVQGGGTGIAVGTQYGLPYFSTTTLMASTAAGTTTTVLHGNAAGAPAFGAVVEADITLADNTTNNVTNAKHGFVPKATDVATDFLRADGTWATPAGAGDVTSVGDCTSGACGDGTSDGGTYIELYNAAGNTRIVNTAGVLEAKTAAGAAYANFKAASITTSAVDGSNKLTITNNTVAVAPTASAYELYPDIGIWKLNQGGTEYSIPLSPLAGQITFTGPTAARSFALPDEASSIVHTATGAATDNVLVRMDGTTGKKVQDSIAVLSDTGDLSLGTLGGLTLGTTSGNLNMGAGYFAIKEMTAPGAGAADTLRLYAEAQPTTGFSMLYTVDSGGMRRQLLRDSVITVYNSTVSTIAIGKPVYHVGTATNNFPDVALARANSITTMPAICLTVEAIAAGAYGRCMQVGALEGINTDGFSVAGDPVYVDAAVAGDLTLTVPVAPNLRQEVGTVLVKSATVGAIQVVARSVQQNDTGTALNDWILGAGTAGTAKRVLFRGAVDGILTWTPTSSTRTITVPDTSGTMALVGGIATDTIWAATGDILVGTGNDTAAILTKGAQYSMLQVGASTLGYSTILYPASATTNGIWYGGSATQVSQTAVATVAGQVLTAGATPFVPAWSAYALLGTAGQTYTLPGATATLQATTGTPAGFIIASQTIGDILYASSTTTWERLGRGAEGSFLMSNAAGQAPSYLAPGAAGYLLVGGGVSTIPTWTASTGTGAPVRGTSPTFTTSILPSAAGATAIGTTALPFSSIFIGDAATNNVQLINTAAASAVVLTLPSTSGTLARLEDKISDLAASTSAEFITKISDETGTGLLVFNNTPTLVTPALGAATATSLVVADVTNDNYIKITNNAARAPTASVNEVYPEANIWKLNQNGTESAVVISPTAGQVTLTGPTAPRSYAIADRAGIIHTSGAACTALTPAAAVALDVTLGDCYTDTVTDNENQTITFSAAGVAGQRLTIIFTTAGTADEIITFEATLVSSVGTLTLGTTAARYYTITFVSNGTHWYEVARTAEQT